MHLYTGTSGFAYKEWKGAFYPEDVRNDGMLAYYATQFRAVEINNSFYLMPAEKTLAQWSEQVPPHFRFVLKAPQRITHFTRLKQESKDPLEYFLKTVASLGPQLLVRGAGQVREQRQRLVDVVRERSVEGVRLRGEQPTDSWIIAVLDRRIDGQALPALGELRL